MKNITFGGLFEAAWREVTARRPARKSQSSRRVRLWLDNLEDRSVPSVAPVLPPALVSDTQKLGVGFSPQVAISPLDSNTIVEVHSNGVGLQGNYSTDGGQTWTAIPFALDPNQPATGPAVPINVRDPNVYQAAGNATPPPFTVVESPSIAFDRNGILYIVSSQHNAAGTSGAIILEKHDFSIGGTGDLIPFVNSNDPDATPGVGGNYQRLYSWFNQDIAYNPVIAIDINAASFTDPLTGATSTDTLADKGFLKNTSLTVAGIDNVTTDIPVTSTANLPAVPFLAQIDNEQVLVTAIVGTDLTVTRGQNGTTAVAHSGSATLATLSTLPKGIFVAWNVNTQEPALAPLPTTISHIVTRVSADGGETFTTQQSVSAPNPTPTIGATTTNYSSPKIVFTQSSRITTVSNPGGMLATDTFLTIPAQILNFAPKLPVFPGDKPFLIQIGSEQLSVTGMFGTTWTVVRGYNGTTPVFHDLNTPVVTLGGQLTYFFDSPTGIILDQSIPDGGVANGAAAAAQTFTSNGGAIRDASASTAVVTTTSSIALNPGANFIFVPNNANSARFFQNDDILIGGPAPVAVEQFNINSISSTTTTIAPLAAPGPIPPATDTVFVASSAPFLVGDLIQIGTELMSVQAIPGPGSLTVLRAQAGSTAAVQASGSTVTNLSHIRWNVSGAQAGTVAAAHPAGATITLSTGGASVPSISTFTQNVTINAANLTTINDLDVTLDIVHPHLDQLSIVLTPPASSGLAPITLVRNRVDNTNTVINPANPQGLTGANLGVIQLTGAAPLVEYHSVGTVFSDEADRRIGDASATAPYIGYFRPETTGFGPGTGLSSVYGLTNEQLSGVWTLTITDFVNDTTTAPFPVQNVKDWSLNFTGVVSTNGFGGDSSSGVVIPAPAPPPVTIPPTPATPAPGATITGVGSLVTAASGTAGIGREVSIAVDNTLGGFSPYQGRMYMAFNGDGGTDTNVYLATSDDDGATWSLPVVVNDDSLSDNFSEGNRPQFRPTVTVDPITGTVVITYYDARNDASLARVATSIATSIDGGTTFSKVSYLNQIKTETDFLTGNTINVEPIPGNQSQAGTFGFGNRQGLVAYDGNIYPVFSSNLNTTGSAIFTAKVVTAGGPRVIYGDSGVVSDDFTSDVQTGIISYNNTFASDGTRRLDGFVVQFDRPVDVTSFTAADVTVKYQNPNTGAISIVPLSSIAAVTPLDMPQTYGSGFGSRAIGQNQLATEFFVRLQTPQSNPGTYSYSIGSQVNDLIRNSALIVTPVAVPVAPFNAPITATNVPVAIPDLTTVTSTITVPAPPPGQVIASVKVSLDITHTYDQDLVLTLISPTGTRILLSFQNGGSDDNYTGTVFDDTAATSIVSGTGPFTGSFRPEEALSHLIGQDPTGNWTLEVSDTQAVDIGTLNSWSLDIRVGVASGNPIGNLMDQNANGVTGESVTFPSSVSTTLAADMLITDTNNNATQAMTANASTMIVASTVGFPTAPFVVQVGSEQMRVISVIGTTWTVVRGFNGTQATGHSLGDVVVSVNDPDIFSNPTPLGSTPNASITGVPFAGPYDSQTLPLIIPGPHVVRTSLSDATNGNFVPQSVTTTLAEPVVTSGITGLTDIATSLTTGTHLAGSSTTPVMLAAPAGTVQVITVTAAVPPSLTVPFVATIGGEQVNVTAVSGSSWTVTRGFNGTTAVVHLGGTVVSYNIPSINFTPFLIRIDNEVMQVTAITGPTWTILRGFDGTLATDHSVDAIIHTLGGIDELTTTFVVTSSVGFPTNAATNPFIVQIGGEQIRVTNVDPLTNIWTVIRGVNGTTIADEHSNGATITYVPDVVALNRAAGTNSIDLTFDRTMNASSITAADILSVTGPLGNIAGPFTVTANPVGTPLALQGRVFRIGFPTQTLSGNYSVVIAPSSNNTPITDLAGNALDINMNAGLDVLRGQADPLANAIQRPVYAANPNSAIPKSSQSGGVVSSTISVPDSFNIVQSTSQLSFSGQTTTKINQTGGIDALTTSITVPSTVIGFPSTAATGPFVVQIDNEQIQVINNANSLNPTMWTVIRGFNNTTATTHTNNATITLGQPNTIEVMLSITQGNIQDLTVTLTSPTGKVITLAANTGAFGPGPHANFTNTVLDDSASIPVQNAPAPVSGIFNPVTPLSVLDGTGAAGTWTLTVKNKGSITGVLTHWELRLPKTVPTSGMGEAVADRIQAGFRIFSYTTTNPLSTQQWVPVGPVGNTLDSTLNGDNAGPVQSVTVDPSDPTGNTVYAGAATGGIWKTTNFLTTDSAGPNWIPLTDFGAGNSLDIGSIAVFSRNNDPSKTVIIAATGNAGTVDQGGAPALPNDFNTTGGPGVGFIRSQDGGKTWQVLDSLTNIDTTTGAILPMNSPLRLHEFVGTTGFKVLIDPTPQPNGGLVVYAALSGTNGGVYRSNNGGNTWTLIMAGNATDISLASASRDENGNLTTLFAAFRGLGVYRAVGPALSSTSMTLLVGGGTFTPRVDVDFPSNGSNPIPTTPPANTPNGAKGNIVLAQPSLANNPLADTFYQGWLYAAVADAAGGFDGLYVTKDFGNNWTQIDLPLATINQGGLILHSDFATNNEVVTPAPVAPTPPNPVLYDPTPSAAKDGNLQSEGNYALSLTVDPNNPNIAYMGGAGGIVRIDITTIDDPYSLSKDVNNDPDGGKVRTATVGSTGVKVAPATQRYSGWGIINPADALLTSPNFPPVGVGDFFNLYREPSNPFVSPSSLQFTGVTVFRNTGTEISWMPFALNTALNQHQILAINDPLTGGTRILLANDSGVQTGVDDGTGQYLLNVGASPVSTGYRNGNMQTAQLTAGAAQPSSLADALAGALFYGSSTNSFGLKSNPNVLTSGDIRWTGTGTNGTINSSTLAIGRVTGAAGIATDPTGSGQLYQFQYPSTLAFDPFTSPFVETDFFQVTPAAQAAISRVSGLVQFPANNPSTNTGEWPEFQGSNFAVNPIDPTAIVISSQQGNLFLTAGKFTGGTGVLWNKIGSTGDTSYAPALAFGALDTVHNTKDNFIYAGYSDGKVFVTTNGGSTWTDISAGLDGSGLGQIVTNPNPDSHEAYAVTANGVYWMRDSTAVGATWSKISDNIGTATTLAAAIANPTVATLTVASRVGFPTGQFIIQVGSEQMLVSPAAGQTSITSTTWNITRGYNNTVAVAHPLGSAVTMFNPLLGTTSAGVTYTGLTRTIFGNAGDTATILKYINAIQADWRFSIPDATIATTTTSALTASATPAFQSVTVASSTGVPSVPFSAQIGTETVQVTAVSGTSWTITRGFNGTAISAHAVNSPITPVGGTHPVLYIAGSGGVFRSRDKGQTWTFFPNIADGSVQDGGVMPSVNVTSLNLMLGNMNPQTGFTDNSTGYNTLLATTYGRGDFAIRLDNTPVAQYTTAPNGGPQVSNLNPTVIVNGSQLAGYTVTFKGAVDPLTFTSNDVTVTGPSGTIPLASGAAGISLISGNQFQLTFATPQITAGNYTINIGPKSTGTNIMDFSGNLMDQNNNNKNGEPGLAPTGDTFTNTFAFASNKPPIISGSVISSKDPVVNPNIATPIPNQVLAPGATGPAIPFFIGDAETPSSGLTLTPAPSVTTLPGFTGSAPTITIGGSGTNLTVQVTAQPGSHGSATVTLTVQDASLLQTSTTFTVFIDTPPTLPPITNPTVVDHGATPAPYSLNATDAEGDPLTFSVAFTDPLFTIQQQYGIQNSNPYPTNSHGAGEVYLNSTQKGVLVLLTNGQLRQYNGTFTGTLLTTVSPAVVANPALLTTTTGTPLVSVPNPLYDLKVKYGFTADASSNYLGANEKYLGSTSNGRFILTSDNKLYTWDGSTTKGVTSGLLIADFTALGYGNVYANPALLTGATPGTAVGITASTTPNPNGLVPGGTITITPAPAFYGSVNVKVTANDGALNASQSFVYTVNESAPAIAAITDQTGSHTTPLTVPISVTDANTADNNPANLTYSVEFSNPLLDIKNQYALVGPAGAPDATRGGAEFFTGTGGYYALKPGNILYKSDGGNGFTSPQDLSAYGNVYANPALLLSAISAPPTANVNHGTQLYDLKTQYGLDSAPAYFNKIGQKEIYFYSRTQGGYNFFLKPNGDLFSVSNTVTPVASLGASVYNDPTLLYQAQQVFVNDTLAAVKAQYGLNKQPVMVGTELYFDGVAGSTAYFMRSNGDLFLRDGSKLNVPVGPALAQLGAAAYTNPALLYDATAQRAAATGVVNAAGTQLTLTPNSAFVGVLRVTVKASDGAQTGTQSFLYTVANTAPVQTQIPDISVATATGSTQVNLPTYYTDADTLAYAASISDPLYDIKTHLGLNTTVTTKTGSTDKFLSGLNFNYFLRNDGNLYLFDGTNAATGVAIANVGIAVYNTPTLLTNAQPPTAPLTLVTAVNAPANKLTIAWPVGYTGKFKVTLTADDGATGTQQIFFVTVS